MTAPDPFQECLLSLRAAIGESVPPIVAGGYGLYLKQHSILHSGTRTLLRPELLPDNRTTHDIDLFLRAEVVVSASRMMSVRRALDRLGFAAVPGSEYLQFAKAVEPVGSIKIDFLVGPLGDLFDPKLVKRDDRRVRPKAFGGLHAHPLDEAIAVEEHTSAVPLGDTGVSVEVPQPFTYLLMKLLAFRDRCHDERKDMARHHALDIYRIIAMITPEEDSVIRALAATHLDHPKVVEARRVVGERFAAQDSLGILRLREHQLFFERMDLDTFRAELFAILPPLTT
jgi:hypothetical protein